MLPLWASDERMVDAYVSAIADFLKDLPESERLAYRSRGVAQYGRFAEIIYDLAAIKADAPLLLTELNA